MFSYEARIRAVKLYIKLGKRAAVTVRILGYPSKKYLRRWYLTYIDTGDLPKEYKRKPRYSDEQKQQAVEHYFNHGQCLAYTKRVLGYPSAEIFNIWLDEITPNILRKRYTQTARGALLGQDVKKQAVIDLCSRKGTASAVAKEIGVTREVLYKWKDKILPAEYSNTMQKQKPLSESADKKELQNAIEQLHLRIHTLQLEHDILNKANELIKKENGISHQALTNHEKTILIDALLVTYKLKELLATLELARSSYFYHRARNKLPDKYASMRALISEIFYSNNQCYGYRRIQVGITQRGSRLSEKVIRRLMSQEHLIAHSSSKRRRYSSYYGEISPAAENIIDRDFRASVPNEKWLTDISEFQIPAGKIYLSPIIDCFDGLIVSWSLGTRPNAELVNTMLDKAISTLGDSQRPIVHSDRGAHYRWPGWLERIERANLIRSMSRKGCSPDNAACEGFFGRLKTEFFYPRDWREASLDYLMKQLDEYIQWYNQKRIKLSLGAKSPVEYRLNLFFET